MDLLDKTVLVYGASGGLGSAIAGKFASLGCRTIGAGRNPEKLKHVKERHPAITEIRAFDFSENFNTEILSDVDIVINAAGCDIRKRFVDQRADEISRQIYVNLAGAVRLTGAGLISRPPDKFFQILHVGGFGDGTWPSSFYTVDTATRAGLFTFLESLRFEIPACNRIFQYFCPLPADTEAERPYHPLWKKMGIPVVTPDRVAAEIIKAVGKRKAVHIMGGFSTRLVYRLRKIFPRLTDCTLVRMMNAMTENFFLQKEGR